MLESKKVVAYGATLELCLTLNNPGFRPDYIVDDTSALHGKSIHGIPIEDPARLTQEDPESLLVIICASRPPSIQAIANKLERAGLTCGAHYLDSSLLHFDGVSERLRRLGIDASYERFVRARLLCIYGSQNNLSHPAGTWLIAELLESLLPRVPGEVAECGVYYGGNAFCQLMLCPELSRRSYHLLDSFQGFPELSDADPVSRAGEFADVELSAVRRLFSDYAHVQIHPGFFSQTLPTLGDRQFSFVYVDCDLYQPTLECIDYFYPRLAPGGCVLFHDCQLPEVDWPQEAKPNFWGARRAVWERFAQESIIVFPQTTHALVIKDAG